MITLPRKDVPIRHSHPCTGKTIKAKTREFILGARGLSVLGPLVLAADLLLFLGGEIVRDVECLADLLGGLALDHVGDRLAADVEERLDVQVVGGLEAFALVCLISMGMAVWESGEDGVRGQRCQEGAWGLYIPG